MKLYTADAIKEQVHKLLCKDCGETDYCPKCDYRELIEQILDAPTVDAEPTEEQVKEFCRKRCLVIVNSELFNEMKARWSAEPVRHGHWVKDDTGAEYCSNCHEYPYDDGEYHIANWHSNYCPKCGAMMQGGNDGDK